MDFLKRKPKNLEAAEVEQHDTLDATGSIAENSQTQKRQKMLMFGLGGVIAIAGAMYVLDTDDTIDAAMTDGTQTTVSTDALMNRQRVDQEWVAMYEGEINTLDTRVKGTEAQGAQLAELKSEVEQLRGANAEMARDGQRVLEAYERENQQLRQQVQRGNARPTAPGPVAAAQALGVPPAQGSAAAAPTPPRRSNDVQMVSFAAEGGTASRIDPSNSPAVYTDSPNYLPPNSIAKATVVVGVDATTNTRSQSDPLPVLLRVTGPARSVYGEGKLLATRVQGCMVNGAAYGDLSSEKVYVKLQRMTCAQPGGRFAVSEVKGFIAFGGKVGVRGRVVTPTSNFSDRLRLGMVRAVAMIELLLEGWCEPPQREALHLSTLVHQILSVIAERGGIGAQQLYRILCQIGPFRQVNTQLFLDVLRTLGQPEVALIEQASDGILLLGANGEKLVEHYSFYAVFQTPEEYRLIFGGRELGTLPIDNMIAPGMLLIFSGRRWLVQEVHDRDRVIMVAPAKAGAPPIFGGDPGNIHGRVIERMFTVLKGKKRPIYLDATALELLDEARSNYAQLQFDPGRIAQLGDNSAIIATKTGSVRTTTLALALRASDFTVQTHDGFLEVFGKDEGPDMIEALSALANGKDVDLFAHSPNLLFEKFHPHLPKELLERDVLSSRLHRSTLPSLASEILGQA